MLPHLAWDALRPVDKKRTLISGALYDFRCKPPGTTGFTTA
jgi:hypothetical protein